MSAAIETLGLGKVFNKRRSLLDMITHPFRRPGTVQALAGVDLMVQHGEIFGLLGPNGAGKTTLLKILSSLITPTSGAAFINGHDVVGAQQAVRASIGLVTSDERSFYWRLSGRENLHFFAALADVPGHRIRARCQTLLKKVEMEEKADQPFMEYSTGTKQRLAAARALLHDPPIMYMDEPTRSLDPTAAKNLRAFVQETLNGREGKTILLATHNLAEAESLCHRLAILHKSEVRRIGTVEEVCSAGRTRERYVLEIEGLSSERIADPGGGFAFDGCSVSLQHRGAGKGAGAGGTSVTLVADVDRGGAALSELLKRLLGAGGIVVSCTRREANLEEVFDLVAGEGGGAP
jgi:ABC-2 type transport system ATP-binding protein